MLIVTCVVATGLVIGSITDVRRFKVYNALTFPLFFAGLVYGAITEGWSGFAFSFAGAATAFAILLLPYLMGGLGAGDVKFVMAIGTWLGAALMLPAIILGCIAVLAYHSLILARQQGLGGLWHSTQMMLFRLRMYGVQFAMVDRGETVQAAAQDPQSPNHGRLIPFSAMMSIGIVIVLVYSWYTGTLPR